MDRVPPVLRRRFRACRLAYAAAGLLETFALAATLAAAGGPRWPWLALGWLVARAARWPTDYTIACRLEQRHPELGETLTAAVQLARSRDDAALRGSPALRAETYAAADRQAAPLAAARLVSWRPAIALATVAVAALLVLRPVPAPEIATGTRPPPDLPDGSPPPTNAGPAMLLEPVPLAELGTRLAELSRQLAALPEPLRRELPSHVRSLDQARETLARAEAALARGDAAEAAFLTEAVAELLAEFARLAQAVPALASLAATAGQLAGQYAAWGPAATELARAHPITPGDVATSGGPTNGNGRLPTATVPLPDLPGHPADAAWPGPADREPDAAVASLLPVRGYERATREYYERLAGPTR